MNGVWRTAAVWAGVALIVGGVPLFLTPLPGGLAAIALGTGLVLTWSTRAQRFVRRKREHHPKLDRQLDRLEQKMPDMASAPLEKTRPDNDDDDVSAQQQERRAADRR